MVDQVNKKWTIGVILVIILSISSIFIFGFKLTTNKEPKEVYNIYLDGNKIGTVKSKENFEEYINKQEEALKKKYGVSKIYTPKGVEIKKIITYNDNCDSNEKIYNLLVKEQNFTLKGTIIEIEKEVESDDTDDKEQKKEIRSMKTEDIDAMISRYKKEKELRSLTREDLTPGRKIVSDILASSASKVLAAAATGALAYAVNYAINKKGNPDFKPDYSKFAEYVAPNPNKKK